MGCELVKRGVPLKADEIDALMRELLLFFKPI